MAKMSGVDRQLARLAALPPAMQEAAASQLEQEVDQLVAAMQNVAPVGETGNLRASIRKEKGARPLSWRIVAGGPLTTVKIRKGVSDSSFAKAKAGRGGGAFDYTRGVEFGHLTIDGSFVPAEPFFFPTYRARKSGLKRRVMAAAKKPLKTLFPKV